MRASSTSRKWWVALTLAVAWLPLVLGCEPGVSVPDEPLGPSIATKASEPVEAVPTVGAILPESGDSAIATYERVIRREAARQDAIAVLESSPIGQQAEMVRDLAGRGLSSLIVLPAPEAAIGSALKEVQAAGLPVLILGRPAPSGAEDLPRVIYTPFDQSARELVKAAVEQAREAGFPEDAPALILVNGPYNEEGRALLGALRLAIEEAGVPMLPELAFQGTQQEAEEAFQPFLDQHPDVGMVFTIEDHALKALATVRNRLDHDSRRFVIAGFVFDPETVRFGEYNLTAAIAQLRPQALAQQAFQSALELATGQTIKGPVEVETRLILSDGPEREGYQMLVASPEPLEASPEDIEP